MTDLTKAWDAMHAKAASLQPLQPLLRVQGDRPQQPTKGWHSLLQGCQAAPLLGVDRSRGWVGAGCGYGLWTPQQQSQLYTVDAAGVALNCSADEEGEDESVGFK